MIGERNRSSRSQSSRGSSLAKKRLQERQGKGDDRRPPARSDRGRPSRTVSGESARARRPASERWSADRRRRAWKARGPAAARAPAAWPRPGRPRRRDRPSGRGTAPTAVSPACGNRPDRSRSSAGSRTPREDPRRRPAACGGSWRSAGDRRRGTPSGGRFRRDPGRSRKETPRSWHREANHGTSWSTPGLW